MHCARPFGLLWSANSNPIVRLTCLAGVQNEIVRGDREDIGNGRINPELARNDHRRVGEHRIEYIGYSSIRGGHDCATLDTEIFPHPRSAIRRHRKDNTPGSFELSDVGCVCPWLIDGQADAVEGVCHMHILCGWSDATISLGGHGEVGSGQMLQQDAQSNDEAYQRGIRSTRQVQDSFKEFLHVISS